MSTLRAEGGRRRLFWRVYLFGAGLVAIVLASVLLIFTSVGKRPPWLGVPPRIAQYVSANIERGTGMGSPDGIEELLDGVAKLVGGSLAVYTRDGRLVASAGTSPPPPLSESERSRIASRSTFVRGTSFAFAAEIRGEPGGYVVMAWEDAALRVVLNLAVIALLLALLPLVFARGIARPLERLTETARALRDGDLAARSGIERSDEIGILGRALDEMAQRVEHLVRTDKVLLAGIAHEIRTPLSRIRVALDLLEVRPDGAPSAERLAGISEDLLEMETLVADVLAAARLDLASGAGATATVLSGAATVDLGAVVRTARDRFDAAHPGRALSVEAEDGPLEVVGDAALLRRVIDNLLENAAKYTAAQTPIGVSARRAGDRIVLEVADGGPGVSIEDLDRLFDPFFRARHAEIAEATGFGMGLALCRRIVESHGGTITAGNRPGGGLVVRAELPAAPMRR